MNKFIDIIKKNKFIVMGIILLCLVIILICVAFKFFGKTPDSDRAETTKNSAELLTSSGEGYLSGDSKILVVCNGKTAGDMSFAVLVDFKVYSETIIITVLDKNTSSANGSYKDCYAYGGIAMLKDAVQTTRDCAVDRYIIMSEDGFDDIAEYMGKVTVDVAYAFTYTSADKSYTVEKGKKELDSDMLLAYLQYILSIGDSELFVNVLCGVVNTYLPDCKADEADDLFKDLSNYVKTDITIADYYSAQSDIEHLLTNDTQCIPYSG